MARSRRFIGAVVVVVTLFTGGSTAWAYTCGCGNSANAPGQERAVEQCNATIDRQVEKEVGAGGGHKEEFWGRRTATTRMFHNRAVKRDAECPGAVSGCTS